MNAERAFDIFLKIDGVEGESTQTDHVGEIEISAFEQGLANAPGTPGSGGGAGKPTFHDLRFRKRADKSSPRLALLCATGQHVKSAAFTFRRAVRGGSLAFLQIRLSDVLITGVKTVAGVGMQYPLSFELRASDEGAGLLEEIALNFARIEWEYQPLAPDGTPGESVKAGWDVQAGKKI